MAHDVSISPRLSPLRRQKRSRRSPRPDRRLEAELAQYNTVADRQELDAILSRHTPEETAPLRSILARQPIQD